MVLEADALLGDLAELGERPDLEAPGVGKNRFVPGGKTVEPTHFLDQLVARAEPEVVGVAEDDLRSQLDEFVGVQGFHGPLGADGHENRSFHRAMRELESALAGGAIGIGGE